MTAVKRLADFAVSAPYEELSEAAHQQLKIRVICPGSAESQFRSFAATLPSSMPTGNARSSAGGRASPEHAAFYNGAAVRYLDFNEQLIRRRGRTLPSQPQSGTNFGSCGVFRRQRPRVDDCPRGRLPGAVPIERSSPPSAREGSITRYRGPMLLLPESRGVGLHVPSAANAIAISGTALNALRVMRTGKSRTGKGLAYPHWPLAHPRSLLAGNERCPDELGRRSRLRQAAI